MSHCTVIFTAAAHIAYIEALAAAGISTTSWVYGVGKGRVTTDSRYVYCHNYDATKEGSDVLAIARGIAGVTVDESADCKDGGWMKRNSLAFARDGV